MLNNNDRVQLDISYFDYKLIQEGLKLLYNEKLRHTPWVPKPRYEGYGSPVDYWYEGNKSTRQIQSIIKYLEKQISNE